MEEKEAKIVESKFKKAKITSDKEKLKEKMRAPKTGAGMTNSESSTQWTELIGGMRVK
jgi:hypothetical protein